MMTTAPEKLSYDVVMATRNRPEAVELSLPLLVHQTRPPAQIVIVDSSDDSGPISAIAETVAATAPMPVHYLRAEAGLTHQRNVGLARCSAAVVLFPDDDSLLHRDAAERIMAIYEADTEGAVAGVAGAPVETPPEEALGKLGSYAAERTSALRSLLRGLRQSAKEATGFLNPFVATGRRLSRRQSHAWLGRDAIRVPYMTGFRMSFRRAAIAPTGFDEALRKYAWFEDIDASYAALRHGLVVTARDAGIYHHRAAEKRDSGHRMGLWAILNRTYVVMKAVRTDPEVFPRPRVDILRLRVYCLLRTLAYSVMARDQYGRDRARGARDGLRRQARLLHASRDDLAAAYRSQLGE